MTENYYFVRVKSQNPTGPGFFMGGISERKARKINGYPKPDQRTLYPDDLESFVLAQTRISFIDGIDEFVIFKTPHNTLGFYCTGTVTTIAKWNPEGETPIEFDQLQTLCDSCDGREVFPIKGKKTAQAVKTAKKLNKIRFKKPDS